MLARRQVLQLFAATGLVALADQARPRASLSEPAGARHRHHRTGRAGRHHGAA